MLQAHIPTNKFLPNRRKPIYIGRRGALNTPSAATVAASRFFCLNRSLRYISAPGLILRIRRMISSLGSFCFASRFLALCNLMVPKLRYLRTLFGSLNATAQVVKTVSLVVRIEDLQFGQIRELNSPCFRRRRSAQIGYHYISSSSEHPSEHLHLLHGNNFE